MPYLNAASDIGKKTICDGGLLHLAQENIRIDDFDCIRKRVPWDMHYIYHSYELDTLLEYCHSALLHLVIPPTTPPEVLKCICELIFSRLSEEGDFNLHISVESELTDSITVELLATDAITAKETEMWI